METLMLTTSDHDEVCHYLSTQSKQFRRRIPDADMQSHSAHHFFEWAPLLHVNAPNDVVHQ
jgi:hypothetical protein